MRLFRALTASLSLVSSAACGGGDLVLPEDQSPADMVLVDGDGQAGSVGAELPDPLVVLSAELAIPEPSSTFLVPGSTASRPGSAARVLVAARRRA